MKLWSALYNAIWVVFLEAILGLWPDPPWIVPYLHLVLGLGIVYVTYYVFRELRKARVPGRVKRVARASYYLSIAMVVLGFMLWFDVGSSWTIPLLNLTVWRVWMFFHVTIAFAIITQLAAAAIAYDMWEDHEFEKETEPGEVPAPAVPAR
jgi:hypothetical protein